MITSRCPGYELYLAQFRGCSDAPTPELRWARECVRLGTCFHAALEDVAGWLAGFRAAFLPRQAQSLTKACHYHDLASQAASDCLAAPHYPCGDDCGQCASAREQADAEAAGLDARRDKALRRVSNHVAVIAAIQSDPAVLAAASRTVRLLGADVVNVHAFGEGWRDLPQLAVFADTTIRRLSFVAPVLRGVLEPL